MSIISKIDDFLKKDLPKKRQVIESNSWELNEEYDLDDVLNKMVNFISAIDRDVLSDEGRAMADEIMASWNSGQWEPARNKSVDNHQSTTQPVNLNPNATMDVPDEDMNQTVFTDEDSDDDMDDEDKTTDDLGDEDW